MKFYNTSDYLASEIAKKEAELKKLKKEVHDAQVREFYWHINSRLREMDEEFYNTQWTISFGNQSITLPNCAEVFQGIEQTIFDYMEDEGIENNKEESNGAFVIVSNDFDYTGGGCWVLFTELWLPGEGKRLYATTDEYHCFFYNNEDDYNSCQNADYGVYCEHVEEADSKYRDIARELFAQFERDLAKERG